MQINLIPERILAAPAHQKANTIIISKIMSPKRSEFFSDFGRRLRADLLIEPRPDSASRVYKSELFARKLHLFRHSSLESVKDRDMLLAPSNKSVFP
jgi:hypothetical protein